MKVKRCVWCHLGFTPRVARQKFCKRQCKELSLQSRSRGGTGTQSGYKRKLGHLTPEERKAYDKTRRRECALRFVGWTVETFTAAKREQRNRCAICGDTPEPMLHAIENLVPDHKHVKPPKPRGLLCCACNSLIGFAKDSPERCEAAAAYLRHWGKPCKNCGHCLDCLLEERTNATLDDSRIEHCRENG